MDLLLKHKKLQFAIDDKIFENIKTVDEMIKNINKKADILPLKIRPLTFTNEDYFDPYENIKVYKGDMFEIFTEAFLKIYQNDKKVGILNCEPIDITEDLGVDFVGKSTINVEENVCVQSKFRSNEMYQFSYRELSTFMSTSANQYKAFGRNQVLITTSKIIPNIHDDVVNYIVKNINPDLRVIEKSFLQQTVDNNKGFWDTFKDMIEKSSVEQKPKNKFDLYSHQEEMLGNIKTWL